MQSLQCGHTAGLLEAIDTVHVHESNYAHLYIYIYITFLCFFHLHSFHLFLYFLFKCFQSVHCYLSCNVLVP